MKVDEISLAVALAVFHLSLCIVGDSVALGWLGRIVWCVGQYQIFIGALIMAVAWVRIRATPHAFLRRSATPLLFIYALYLVLDQGFYELFGSHYSPYFSDDHVDLRSLSSSILYELRTLLPKYAALLCVFGGAFWWLVKRSAKPRLIARRDLVLGALLLAISTGYGAIAGYNVSHPITAMLYASTQHLQKKAALNHDNLSLADLYPLKFGTSTPTKLTNTPWDRPPNIVYLIIESVGALQLLQNGEVRADLAPHLASLREHSTIVTRVYNTFPGTTRSHLPIMTGGTTLTFGNLFTDLAIKSGAPTLVGSLRKAGYATALYSAAYLDAENLDDLYSHLPWDQQFSVARSEPPHPEHLNSWGVRDGWVFARANGWIDEMLKQKKPFYLQLLNSNTHHPYATPGDNHQATPDDQGRAARYIAAIRYLDKSFGEVVAHLRERKIFDNTVIIVTGDHGQAFGDLHPGNWTHKNKLYEENIRNFMLVIDPRKQDGPTIHDSPASLGDVAPTILAAVGADGASEMSGQSLYSGSYASRIHYFHKTAEPHQIGLLDGQYKFIALRLSDDSPELYDLSVDPQETHNIAKLHADRIHTYRKLVVNWTDAMNKAYLSSYAARDAKSDYGNDQLILGATNKHKKIIPDLAPRASTDVFSAIVVREFADEDKRYIFEWRMPGGKVERKLVAPQVGWNVFWHHAPRTNGKLAVGLWRVRVSRVDDDKKALIRSFEVAPD